MGGALSGALTGLGADLMAGGLTFGAGLLTGAVLGALGGAGMARGVNRARGRLGTTLRWDDAFLSELVVALLLRYLAVAHYGRGRGEWHETEYPPFWQALVTGVVAENAAALVTVWGGRAADSSTAAIALHARPLLAEVARTILARLYPDSF
jgi:hypothetical protein